MAVKKTNTVVEHTDVERAAITERAHQIYLERLNNNKPGTPEDDWLQAEKELAKKKK